MNSRIPSPAFNALSTALDRILAEVAFNVQLPPSLHRKATDRYKAIREYLEGTELFDDQIEHFYPQGSMAIDATISNRRTDDEYDIDIVAQLGGRFVDMEPHEILDDLFEALKDYRGLEVKRQTRCLTIYYADGMHLDITPAIRDEDTPDRQSVITHAKGPGARSDDKFVAMNAYGFIEWYAERTPIEMDIVEIFDRRWRTVEASQIRADADIDEVPSQTDFVVKNTATVALQLLKRYRNIRYANYIGRMPPSVMLSYYAGKVATPSVTLSEMLIRLCRQISREIRAANGRNQTLWVTNPRYSDDVFTDRWPEDVKQQMKFARYLDELASGLETAHDMSAGELGDWLRSMFGDRVVSSAADRVAAEAGKSIRQAEQSYTPSGAIILPAAAGLAAPSVARAAPAAVPHTFHGGRRK